ncbi:MAG TPA: LacI family DNA-binding transcriptional regulator [Microbacteriaceae bacterium]|nr:LacI family DNA-binding transcriptional regulator [Microbacteriaceae bacterium]
MPLIGEIAGLLGLDRTTVSRALRGEPGIQRETVDAVRDLASELRSAPKTSGAWGRRSSAVGVVVPSVNRWFYTLVLSGIDKVLAENDFDLVLYDLSQPANVARLFDREHLVNRVDGLLIIATEFELAQWDVLIGSELPMISVGPAIPELRRIGVDDFQVATAVTERVIAYGHTRIGYLGGFDETALVDSSVNDRERAFRDTLAAADIPFHPEWNISGEYRMGKAKEATEVFLAQGDLPTAIVCASDEMALGALYAVSAAGLTPGREISLIGIDGHEYGESFGLATAAQYPDEQGALAADAIVSELSGRPFRSTFVPARWNIIERASLGRPLDQANRAE